MLTILLLLVPLTPAFGQSTSLALSSGTTGLNGTVSLNLSLTSPATNIPSGIQWTLSYTAGDVASVSIAAGPALTAANKTLNCNTIKGSSTCLAVGLNANPIHTGVVAVVTVTLPSATSSASVPLSIKNPVGVLADGTSTTVSGTGSVITVQGWQPTGPSLSFLQWLVLGGGVLLFTALALRQRR